MANFVSSYGDKNDRYADENKHMSSKRKQTGFRYDHAPGGTRTFTKESEPLPANWSSLNRQKITRTLPVPKSPGTRHTEQYFEGKDLASVHTDAERWQDGTLEQLRKDIAILEAKIESLENENQILQSSNAQFVKAASDDRKRYDQLRTEIKRNRTATGSLRTEYSKHENTSFVGNKQGTIQNARGFDTGRSSQAQISEQENTELKEKVAVLVLQLGELKDLQKLLIEKEKHNEELQKTVSDLRAHISTLDQEIGRLTSEIKEQKRRSDSITKQMSLKTDSGGRFENLNDEFSNSNIAQRLRHLYDNEWVNIYKKLGREFPQMNEFERIKKLSAVVKCCYWESTYLADTHTKQMLMITRKESGESPYDREEVQEMLTHRRRFCQKEYVRTRVKTKVLEIVMSSKEVKHLLDLDNRKAINEKLESFCSNIIDGCWLVAISHPPMFLNFNVVGRQFKGLEQSWMEFSTKKPVEDMSKFEGTIAEVVWPSLELKDGSGLSMKGDAIVVKIGKTLKCPPRHGFIGSPNNNDESNRGKLYTFDI